MIALNYELDLHVCRCCGIGFAVPEGWSADHTLYCPSGHFARSRHENDGYERTKKRLEQEIANLTAANRGLKAQVTRLRNAKRGGE